MHPHPVHNFKKRKRWYLCNFMKGSRGKKIIWGCRKRVWEWRKICLQHVGLRPIQLGFVSFFSVQHDFFIFSPQLLGRFSWLTVIFEKTKKKEKRKYGPVLLDHMRHLPHFLWNALLFYFLNKKTNNKIWVNAFGQYFYQKKLYILYTLYNFFQVLTFQFYS